jgi:hypothetical protein
MKEVHKRQTTDGVIKFYQDSNGNITTSQPIEGVVMMRWIVTDDPSQYAMGEVFMNLNSAIEYHRKTKDTYIIELSYIDENMPPQYIHVVEVTDDGFTSKIRIL